MRPGWFWLPKGGLEHLISTAELRGFWRIKDGLVARKWERITRVSARQDDFAQNPMTTGRFTLNVTAEDADIVLVSESGPPDPAKSAKLDGRSYDTAAPAVWFLAVDSKGASKTGDPCEWRAPIRVQPDVTRLSDGFKVTLAATPRAAVLRATFDDTDPRSGPIVAHGEIAVPPDARRLRVIAEVGGQFGAEESAPLVSGLRDGPGPRMPAQPRPLKPDAPAKMTCRFEPKDTAAAWSALDRLAKTPGATVHGGSADINGGRSENDFLTLRLGRDVAVPAARLDEKVKELAALLNAPAPTLKLRLDGIGFPSGRDLTNFCDQSGLDFDTVDWQQG
jgi:hypothetical protein